MMHSGPSGIAEAIVAILVPPACREEVLGDLHERFKSPLQYSVDALRTIPPVIGSRIRRAADPRMLVIQAFVLYLSFSAGAWLTDAAILRDGWAFLRLALPAAMALFGLMLDDAYATRERRSALESIRGPLLGLGLALALQGILWVGNTDLTMPRWITFYGCAMSLLLLSAIRMMFPPVISKRG